MTTTVQIRALPQGRRRLGRSCLAALPLGGLLTGGPLVGGPLVGGPLVSGRRRGLGPVADRAHASLIGTDVRPSRQGERSDARLGSSLLLAGLRARHAMSYRHREPAEGLVRRGSSACDRFNASEAFTT
jgi:hypothetical protein